VAHTLERLHEHAAREDPPAVARVKARETELGAKIYGSERAELYGGAPLAIKREVGELEPDKARTAQRNLEQAGLAELVDLRVGDALATLRELPGPYREFMDAPEHGYATVTVPLDAGVVVSARTTSP
jgi:hypothetical protein